MPGKTKAKAKNAIDTGAGVKTTKQNKAATTKEPSTTLPNWPPLTPVLSAVDLAIEERVKDQILIVHGLFTATLSKTLVSFLSTLPLTTTPGKPKRGEATRVSDRFQVDDPTFAQKLWSQTALQSLVEDHAAQFPVFGGEILGLNSNIRVYRYTPGQFFDQHYDESNSITFARPKVGMDISDNDATESVAAKTTWTLLIYLSVCEGGETIFYPEARSKREKSPDPVICETEVGMALLHRHGGECMLHEGAEVRVGEKWVLRSDLVVRR